MIDYWPRLTRLKVRPVLILHLAEKDGKQKEITSHHAYGRVRIKIYL